jgi:hypothetical protein
MKSNIMFAVDTSKEEIIVSASPKGSNKIDFICNKKNLRTVIKNKSKLIKIYFFTR